MLKKFSIQFLSLFLLANSSDAESLSPLDRALLNTTVATLYGFTNIERPRYQAPQRTLEAAIVGINIASFSALPLSLLEASELAQDPVLKEKLKAFHDRMARELKQLPKRGLGIARQHMSYIPDVAKDLRAMAEGLSHFPIRDAQRYQAAVIRAMQVFSPSIHPPHVGPYAMTIVGYVKYGNHQVDFDSSGRIHKASVRFTELNTQSYRRDRKDSILRHLNRLSGEALNFDEWPRESFSKSNFGKLCASFL